MNATYPEMIAGGLLIVRVVIGILMMGHATQKLFGWLGGYGLRGTGGFFEQLGFRPGVVFAAAASLGELTSGLLVALGLFGPVGPALMISVMLVAMLTVRGPAALRHGGAGLRAGGVRRLLARRGARHWLGLDPGDHAGGAGRRSGRRGREPGAPAAPLGGAEAGLTGRRRSSLRGRREVSCSCCFQPKVNEKTSAPASRNSISNSRSLIGFCCRISWYIRCSPRVPLPWASTSLPCAERGVPGFTPCLPGPRTASWVRCLVPEARRGCRWSR